MGLQRLNNNQRRERNVEIEKEQSRNNSTTMGQGLGSSPRITQKQSLWGPSLEVQWLTLHFHYRGHGAQVRSLLREPRFPYTFVVVVCVLVAQLCLTLCDPMDCSPPGKNTGVGCHFIFQGIFLTQGSNWCLLHLLHWQADSLNDIANVTKY